LILITTGGSDGKMFLDYLVYCRALGFTDRPDYGYLRQLMSKEFSARSFSGNEFDWQEASAISSRAAGAAGGTAATAASKSSVISVQDEDDAGGGGAA